VETVGTVAGPDEAKEPARPRIVTAIGRIWLVGGIFCLAIAVVDVIVWVALRPAMPTILGYAEQKAPGIRVLGPYFEHYAAIKSIEAMLAATVIVFAYQFLKMRAWARAALEAASWFYLVYVLSLLGVSYSLQLLGTIQGVSESGPRAVGRLVGSLGVGVLIAGALIWMIVALRGRKVRAAFAVAPR
jgi:hypothetical protein